MTQVDSTKKDFLIKKLSKKLRKNDVAKVTQYIDQADDEMFEALNNIKFKKLSVTLLLSLLFGGLGLGFFYIKEIKMGITCLALNVGIVVLMVILYLLNLLFWVLSLPIRFSLGVIDFGLFGLPIQVGVINFVLISVMIILDIVFFFVCCSLVKPANAQKVFAIL